MNFEFTIVEAYLDGFLSSKRITKNVTHLVNFFIDSGKWQTSSLRRLGFGYQLNGCKYNNLSVKAWRNFQTASSHSKMLANDRIRRQASYNYFNQKTKRKCKVVSCTKTQRLSVVSKAASKL